MYSTSCFKQKLPLEPVSVSLRGLNLKSPAIARAVTIYREQKIKALMRAHV